MNIQERRRKAIIKIIVRVLEVYGIWVLAFILASFLIPLPKVVLVGAFLIATLSNFIGVAMTDAV